MTTIKNIEIDHQLGPIKLIETNVSSMSQFAPYLQLVVRTNCTFVNIIFLDLAIKNVAADGLSSSITMKLE